MKKTLSVILTIVLILSCFSVFSFAVSAAPAKLNAPGNYVLVGENKNLALYLDNNTGDFGLMNQKTGTVWYSTPTDADKDKIAQGSSISELKTMMTVQYITSNYTEETVYSYDASVITERVGNDWVVTYYFKAAKTNFSIPVFISLKEDYLHVELMIDEIKEMGDNRVLKVHLLQFFGAAGLKDTGYAVIPDGTGSLMEFNREMLNSYKYGVSGESLIYAPNPTEVATNNHFINWNEAIRLPVYGMHKNGEGFLNIIDSGSAVSEIQAYISGLYNSYNTISTNIIVRDTQVRASVTGTSSDKSGSYYSDNLPENYIARYYLLDGENADYVGMAEKYREYLINEKGMTPVKDSASNNLSITLFGAVKKQRHFLGIPYTGAEELTSYSETAELINRLQKDKVEKVYINYSGWTSGGLETTTSTSLDSSSLLGSEKEMSDLINKVNKIKNYSLAFDLELQSFYSQNSDIDKFADVAYGLDSAPVTIFKSRISAGGARDGRYVLHQLIHPGHMPTLADAFVKDASAKNVKSFSFDSIGDTLYCAYNMHDESTRDQSEHYMTSIYQNAGKYAGKDGIVSTNGGNAYAAPYVDNVVNAPTTNSRNYITTAEIPFYQIVFRGYVNLASNPVNLDSERDELLLKLAETGMSLYYQLMDAKSTSFHDTTYTRMFACELDDHYEDMIQYYNTLKPVYDVVGNSAISDYKIISDDVRVTTFANGAKVYVNYSDNATVVDGVKIEARNFTVVGGAEA